MSLAPLLLLRVALEPFEALAPLASPTACRALERLALHTAAVEAEAGELSQALFEAAGKWPDRKGMLVALRRAVHQGRPLGSPAGKAAAYLPAGLAERLAGLEARRRELSEEHARYRERFRADLDRSRRALVALCRQPRFALAIRLVGRSLFTRLQGFAPAGEFRRHDERHALGKLAAYAARFAAKTSPNSVFCATALAGWGGARVRGENSLARLDALLSVAEARKVAACLAVDGELAPAVTPRPNPTLRGTAGGGWTFWRPVSPRDEGDEEVRCEVGGQPMVDLLLEPMRNGSPSPRLPELLAALARKSGFAVEDLAGFLGELAGRGLLAAEVEIPYNCRRPLAYVAGRARGAGLTPPWLVPVEALEERVDRLAGLADDAKVAELAAIESALDALPHVRPLRGDELFRFDAATALEVALPRAVLTDLRTFVGRYARLFGALYPEPVLRRQWGRPFLARFPADTDVELLDLYHGVFEPRFGPRPLTFPDPPPETMEIFARVQGFFADKARVAHELGADEVELTDGDWETLFAGLPAEPRWSAGALFQVGARDAAAIEAGELRLAINALFPAGIALARFAHLHGDGGLDEAIPREVRAAWSPLERAGAVLAEITFTHPGRTANAGLRPALFPYEIELPGEAVSPGATAIPLNDLVVRWDSGEERFRLRSLALGAEVLPVISSGINPEGFVSFLVQIGRQGLQPLAHFPGFGVPGLSAWPRFVTGRTVLFRRSWSFLPEDGPAFPDPALERRDPDAAAADFFLALDRWRRRSRLPRHVFVHTGLDPKPFYADLESALSAELLRRALQGRAMPGEERPEFFVTEMLPAPDEMWIGDGRGHYAGEFLVQLRNPD